ncbi:hypothetical protein LshimejAT787_1700800 [Lyophyllum shimeji]|uniref:Uncharacterized protein n=1 Tax=Lyophyllum shimeji TaxID=47721 RepID=A0A9P3UTB4_LYOSH|nr:hypothetical protein LshimejAT787_1700800 [Lyophyllum shimeji]
MFFSASANSSSSTLTPQKAPTKNYEAAFGALSSSYGFAGPVPIVPSSTSSSSSSKKPSKHIPPSMTSASPGSRSPTQPQPQRKNYEAAFGTLVSSYGFGGPIPIVPSKSTKT